jgi:hypothetical protein
MSTVAEGLEENVRIRRQLGCFFSRGEFMAFGKAKKLVGLYFGQHEQPAFFSVKLAMAMAKGP